MKKNPWFRLYTEIIDDEKLGLLAFEDRWHYIALLACKGKGILDASAGELLARKVALKLGLATRELDEVVRRLAEVGLVDRQTMQPCGWDERQFHSDSSTDRVRAFRERVRQSGVEREGNVSETAQETETETETEEEKEKKTEAPRKRSAVASRPDGVSESVWADFLAIRKAKRAPLTATALDGIEREAAKAGLTMEDALRTCCERGWQGFKAEWVKDRPDAIRMPTRTSAQQAKRDDWDRQMEAFKKRVNGEEHEACDELTVDVEARVVGA